MTPLDLSKPFCTKRQRLTLLAKTADGKGLVFERPDSSGILRTDLYGCLPDRGEGKPFVHNGYPEDFSTSRYRSQYAIDDIVFVIRSAAKERRILVGKVMRIEKTGLILSLFDSHGLRISKKRNQGDGTHMFPFGFVFKTPEAIMGYVDDIGNDAEKALTTYRQLMEERSPQVTVPFKVRRRNSAKNDHRVVL